jgi:zinc protease
MKINYLLSISALLALSTTTYPSFAQVKTKPAPSPKSKPTAAKDQLSAQILPTDPAVLIGKLPNGLTYYIRKNIQPKNRAELYLVNKAGSVLETDAQQGLAHFTEHMAFNGTKDFPKNELVNYLQKSGIKFGADLNAYTSFDETVYQLPLPTDSVKIFEKGFTILANWAGMVSFDTDEINSERGVVLEEERLRGKNASERMSKLTYPVLLNNSRYAVRLPIGKEEILKNFKPETIKSFYHDWYRPDLQAVVVVGDFDVKRVEELIKANFSQLKNPVGEKPRTKYNIPPSVGTTVKIVTDKEQPYTIAQIIVKHPGSVIKTEAGYLNSIRNSLFNSMLNARLGELTQKADPPLLYGGASYGGFLGNLDAFTTVAVAKPGELEKAVKAVVAETERARKFGFNQTELDRAKLSVMTAMESAYKEKDKTKSVNYVREYQANFLKGEAIPGIEVEYNLYKKFLDQIKLSEINTLAGKFISDQDRNVIVEAPEKDEETLPTEQTLLTWIKDAANGVTAYVDNVSTKPLLENIPTGTKVVSETKDAAIGTTTLVFGNGVKAILKPTDFKNDQILINGFSFGGTSLASDADFRSANMSDDLVNGSGIADIDEIKLDKMLTGKRVSISPYVSETSQGINGSSNPKDFETALQLVYLYYTQPRSDADIWQSTLTQIKSTLANRGLDPATVFADTVSAVLGDHNIRRMPTTLATLNEAKQDKAFAFYKDRFADASAATFVLTGSFEVEKIKPLLEKYLGGLPATNRKETYKNLGIHAPAGQLTKTVYKGIGDKSNVQLIFSGDYVYNTANNIQLDALGEVLQIKLIERLREKESGVYSPGVRASYSKLPAGRYSIGIYFSCAPVNVEKLIAATMEEIAKIKKDGAQLVDIQKYTAEDKRSTEVQLKENGFWAGHLIRTAQYQEDPAAVLNHNKDLEQVTVQSTKDAANKYLGDNLIKFILYPEKK